MDVKRGVQQGDSTSPKLFIATLENVMRDPDWEDMDVNVKGLQLHHLRFADDIVIIISIIGRSECWPTSDVYVGTLDSSRILRRNVMRSGRDCDVPFSLSGASISESSSYVNLGLEVNMPTKWRRSCGRHV